MSNTSERPHDAAGMDVDRWYGKLNETRQGDLQALAKTIRGGDCVAFVGAGFSAGAKLPGWWELLDRICTTAETGAAHGTDGIKLVRKRLDAKVVDQGSETQWTRGFDAGEAEMLAQLLKDAMHPQGEDCFHAALKQALGTPKPDPAFVRRRSTLLQIPFRAILTTNFDGLLPGKVPEQESYRQLLRDEEHWSWAEQFWPGRLGAAPPGPPIFQLHGRLDDRNSVVFARRDYRDLLYGRRGYLDFLKALMASRTFLFLGFSLSDEYLNLLRGDLLELIGDKARLAYAVMPDLADAEATYYDHHEGVRVLGYKSGDTHADFDRYLEWLARSTNPVRQLQDMLRGCRVLWVDPKPGNNQKALDLLDLAESAGFRQILGHAEAHRLLESEGPWDLVITNWGHRDGTTSMAQDFLAKVRAQPDQPPVIVFASDCAANRWPALRAGAFAYVLLPDAVHPRLS